MVNSAKAQIQIQQANLQKMESDFKRQEELYKKSLISDSEFETAMAAYESQVGQLEAAKHSLANAQASLSETVTSLEKTTIVSPMDGTISSLNSNVGERVFGAGFSSGTPMMDVVDLHNMEAQVEVGENDVILISINDTARIEVDAFPNRKFTGVVYEIGNAAKTTGMSTQDQIVNFIVKIRVLDRDVQFRPGMSCTADIETSTRENVVSVPIQSVTTRIPMRGGPGGGGPGGDFQSTVQSASAAQSEKKNMNQIQEVVFVVDGNKAKKMDVTTGISDDRYIEITTGLNGDEDVVSGTYRAINRELEDGKTITIDKQQRPQN
jgi:HlyD family secretion protein